MLIYGINSNISLFAHLRHKSDNSPVNIASEKRLCNIKREKKYRQLD